MYIPTFYACPAFLAAAADFACFDSDRFEAALWPSRRNALVVAADRFAFGFRLVPAAPFAESCWAFFRVSAETFLGGGRSTPARRAFESPIAMACFVDRAPCLPSRM